MNKILIIASEFPPGPGGIGQHAFSVVQALPSDRALTILANQDYSDAAEGAAFLRKNLSEGQRFVPFCSRSRFLYPLQRIRQALRLVKAQSPERVIVSGQFPLWIGGILKWCFPRLRVEAFVHGTEITPKHNWKDRLNRWALLKMDRVYPVSGYTRSFLPAGLKKERITVVPNGIDTELLNLAHGDTIKKVELRGAPALLTVGNLTYRKGQHRLIKALPVILQKFPEAHYHIVGLPSQQKEMEALARQLGVLSALTFHGRVSRTELYQFYKNAQVFVMLSENQPNGDVEGFGIAILEANAFGMPAIGARGCGIEDAVSSASGFLVEGNDAPTITEALSAIMANYPHYRRGALDWAQQHQWSEIIKLIDLEQRP